MASWVAYLALALAVIAFVTVLILAVLFGLAWTNQILVPVLSSLRIQTSKFTPSNTSDTFNVSSFNSYLIQSTLTAPTTAGATYNLTLTSSGQMPQGYVFYVSNTSNQPITVSGSGFTLSTANFGNTINMETAAFVFTPNRTVQRIE